MAFLIVRALSKSYAVGDRRLPVLRELDLTIDEGALAPSGAGIAHELVTSVREQPSW